MTDFCVNGRFLTQPISGVQRVARQLCRALARSPAKDSFSLVIPPGAEAEADRIGLSFEIVGGASETLLGGILWENRSTPKGRSWSLSHQSDKPVSASIKEGSRAHT